MGTVLALWTAGLVVGMGSAMGVWGGTPLVPAGLPPPLLQLAMQLGALVAGLVGGALVARVINRGTWAAAAREQRFRRLLALSVDGYWEIDADYRLQAAADDSGEMQPLTPERGQGAIPWELPQWHCDADTQDVLQADLQARQPFRDLAVQWNGADFSVRTLLVSGEPRFDARGIFAGYWGVVRDISAERQAQAALEATETRYRELFSRIPTPLLLHRNGRVFEANSAALALFDQPDLQALADAELLSFYESGDSRERARRRGDMLHGQPLGTALPVADFRLVLPGRRLSVRATSVRVDAEGGPATLAIYVDDTERLAAEDAVRRSEAMLSTLVATSPDLITLTDMATGRYAMVNRTFERITGWSSTEALGRTSGELGVWGDVAARETFVGRVREKGFVTDLPVQFIGKAGTSFSMLVSAARFVMDRRDYMVINARDVTEKERERLEREAILLNASIGIAVTRDRQIVLVNRHFEQIFGWDDGELRGQPTVNLWGDASEFAQALEVTNEAINRGEAIEMERQARRKDGSLFTARVRGRVIDPKRPREAGLVWIVEDVTERRQFEQALARARDDAEAANRAKSAFLANTSHELRTPLNGLIGLSRLARDESLGVERRRQYLEQIEQSAQSLAGIISDILDISRIEAGKLPIEATAFDLAAEMHALQRTYAVLADARGLMLSLEVGPGLDAPVRGDPLRVRQILSNFLVNAIKFTEFGSVVMRLLRPAGAAPETVRLEVQDSGPGIAPATLARLFKPFTQADDSTTRRFGGTGLGLSICHELAALMGGRVGADSHEGQGSTFWAELPLPAMPLHSLPPRRTQRVVEGQQQLRGARVLMAEDNAVNMMIAVAMLERWGVTVTQACDGREAVAAVQGASARAEPFHAVLMDVQMPVMSGHEATRALRVLEASGQLQPVPIIALTAAALVSERDEALGAGMNDFLTKPIDADRLFDTLQRWCARSP
jgi:PAS domain S-box-containing protein